MEATWIYPENIGLDQWSKEWLELCKVFGYTTPQTALLLVNIKTNQ